MIDANILLLVNSRSGKGKAMQICKAVKNELATRGISYTLFVDQWPETTEGFSDTWLIGGDGTVNYYINRYQDSLAPLSVFKGGTGNDLAWKLYGDISLTAQVDLVLDAPVRKIDLGSCNGKLYANSLGIGFDGEVLRSMGAIRFLGGHLGYLLVVIRKIFSFREFSFRISAGVQVSAGKYLLVIVNNSTRTGGGFMVSPKASLTDSKLDMVLCEKLPVLKRLRYLPIIEKGKHLDLPFIHYSHEASVEISCEKEVFAQMDGELISAKTFDINVIPGALAVKY